MPYSKDELTNLPFYQGLITGDESKYLEKIVRRTESGIIGDDGILRDKNSGNIILFENIVPGQGTDGTSYPVNYSIGYQNGYFKYEETEDTNKIIDREFTEL